MNHHLMYIGNFLGKPLYIETSDEKLADLAQRTLARLILQTDTDVDAEIARMKMSH